MTHPAIPAVQRAFALLEMLAQAGEEGMRASVLRQRLGVSYSVLYSLLTTLRARGYVEQVHPRGPYRLGPQAARLSATSLDIHASWRQAFREVIPQAWDETVTLELLRESGVLVLDQIPARQPVRVVREPGLSRPLDQSASGRLFLARNPNAKLDLVRKHALARWECSDLVELAAPVCPDGITPQAAVVVHIPRFRWDPQQESFWADRLRAAAARLSHRLGARVYRPYAVSAAPLLGRSRPMSPQAWRAFLQGPWAARLACLRPDGAPHVVPVWYEWRQNAFFITAWPGSRWAAYVQHHPQVALTVDEPWPPLRRVLAWGEAEPWARDEQARALFRQLSARYLGTPLPLPEPAAGWQAFRIVPHKLRAWEEAVTPTPLARE